MEEWRQGAASSIQWQAGGWHLQQGVPWRDCDEVICKAHRGCGSEDAGVVEEGVQGVAAGDVQVQVHAPEGEEDKVLERINALDKVGVAG
jgi:hypothetical protein